MRVICGFGKSEYFFEGDWTGRNSLIRLEKLDFRRKSAGSSWPRKPTRLDPPYELRARKWLVSDARRCRITTYERYPAIGPNSQHRRAFCTNGASGYSPRDTDLSKFDRRLSLIARPIVSLSSEEDPILAIAPALIERTALHNMSGALSGALQGQFWESRQMIAFAGASGARTGLEFNEAVASGFEGLGLKASHSVKPWVCLNQKKTEKLENLGDIDVLVINSSGTVVWVCEAKDLKLCRTLGEAAQRLSEYRGVSKDGKPDKLLRHLRRVEYLRANAAALAKQLKLPTVPTVHGAVIVNSPQPMEQLVHEYVQDSAVVMLDEIGSIPWEAGWPPKSL